MEGRSNVWYLTGRISQNDSIQDIEIDTTPFRIGRRHDLSLTLPYAAVSNLHAEVIVEALSSSIRDLNSTNGTFVNGIRVTQETPLQAGDIIRFADVAFRIQRRCEDEANQQQSDILIPNSDAGESDQLADQFDSLLMTGSVVPHYQPIVSLLDNKLVGNEVLARSRVEGLRTPAEMFLVACQRNLEEELSRMLRMACLERRAPPGQSPSIFLNTHPSEIVSQGLLYSLRALRDLTGDMQMTFEIREPDSADTVRISRLHDALAELGMKLAYDRFGSGRSQHLELAKVRPEFVKFDMRMIRDIHLAPTAQQTLLANLVRMVHDLGIASVAVGVESEAEHAVCCNIGFEYGQGFYYGKPASTQTSPGARVVDYDSDRLFRASSEHVAAHL